MSPAKPVALPGPIVRIGALNKAGLLRLLVLAMGGELKVPADLILRSAAYKLKLRVLPDETVVFTVVEDE